MRFKRFNTVRTISNDNLKIVPGSYHLKSKIEFEEDIVAIRTFMQQVCVGKCSR